MASIPNTLQCTTIANMLATELKRQGIPVAEDPDTFYSLVYAGAELILYEGGIGVDKDIQLCVEKIKEYINETKQNYPNYFLTGEDK